MCWRDLSTPNPIAIFLRKQAERIKTGCCHTYTHIHTDRKPQNSVPGVRTEEFAILWRGLKEQRVQGQWDNSLIEALAVQPEPEFDPQNP